MTFDNFVEKPFVNGPAVVAAAAVAAAAAMAVVVFTVAYCLSVLKHFAHLKCKSQRESE